MKMLLDTHVVLWWLTGDATLSESIRESLDHDQYVFISAATYWEIAIKQSIGKLKAPIDVGERVRGCGFRELPIRTVHAIEAGRLPLIHRDPFDRMLVAQALWEGLTLVTRDPAIRRYDVPVLVA